MAETLWVFSFHLFASQKALNKIILCEKLKSDPNNIFAGRSTSLTMKQWWVKVILASRNFSGTNSWCFYIDPSARRTLVPWLVYSKGISIFVYSIFSSNSRTYLISYIHNKVNLKYFISFYILTRREVFCEGDPTVATNVALPSCRILFTYFFMIRYSHYLMFNAPQLNGNCQHWLLKNVRS